ncbi:MAG: hypothetical protein AABY93_16750 [Bacteroidota bacterium]
MKIAAGIIGLISGIFGVIGGFLQIGLGVIGENLKSGSAETIAERGVVAFWLSWIVIIFSSIVFAKPKIPGVILIIIGVCCFLSGNVFSGPFTIVSGVIAILSESPNEKLNKPDVTLILFGIALIISTWLIISRPDIQTQVSEKAPVTDLSIDSSGNAKSLEREIETYDVITKLGSEEINFETYCNQKFGFCLDYPSEILYPQGESDNGDGQVFKSKDADNTMWVYRDVRNYVNSEIHYTIEDVYNEDSRGNNPDKPQRVITFQKLGEDYFVVSGYNAGNIFYQKTILTNGEFITCLLEYKERDNEVYTRISYRIFVSFQMMDV